MDEKETKINTSRDLELAKENSKEICQKTQQKSTFVLYGFRLCYVFPLTVTEKLLLNMALFHTHLR